MSEHLPEKALTVLRTIWSAQEQTSADLEDAPSNAKVCKNMRHVGFQGLVSEEELAAGGGDIRAAWKAKLEREGKLAPGATSVRDLVLGSSDQAR